MAQNNNIIGNTFKIIFVQLINDTAKTECQSNTPNFEIAWTFKVADGKTAMHAYKQKVIVRLVLMLK